MKWSKNVTSSINCTLSKTDKVYYVNIIIYKCTIFIKSYRLSQENFLYEIFLCNFGQIFAMSKSILSIRRLNVFRRHQILQLPFQLFSNFQLPIPKKFVVIRFRIVWLSRSAMSPRKSDALSSSRST